MTFKDWVDESIERYQTQSLLRATKESGWAFWRGGMRRGIDQKIGSAIWDRGDWDVLVILDACRVDQMEAMRHEYDQLPYDVRAVWSNASTSIDWINRNFNDHPEHAKKTGYVTANPFASHNDPETRSADLTEEKLGHLELLYNHHWQDIGNGIETVPPEVVTDHGINAWRNRDELGIDRLVLHYLQPHEPFRSRPEWGNGESKLLKNLVSEGATAGSSVYPLLRAGEISLDEFWTVYQDNLRWVLDDVLDRLITNCEADIVLSADHGNGLGEWGSWQHPPGTVMPHVRRVPWVEVTGRDERTVDPDLHPTASVERSTQERLESLGYLE